MNAEAIRREIVTRGITYLCHFTTLRNATSMIRMGSSELHFKGQIFADILKSQIAKVMCNHSGVLTT